MRVKGEGGRELGEGGRELGEREVAIVYRFTVAVFFLLSPNLRPGQKRERSLELGSVGGTRFFGFSNFHPRASFRSCELFFSNGKSGRFIAQRNRTRRQGRRGEKGRISPRLLGNWTGGGGNRTGGGDAAVPERRYFHGTLTVLELTCRDVLSSPLLMGWGDAPCGS